MPDGKILRFMIGSEVMAIELMLVLDSIAASWRYMRWS